MELEADGSSEKFKRPLSRLKRVPSRKISIDCDKYKDAVCNQKYTVQSFVKPFLI